MIPQTFPTRKPRRSSNPTPRKKVRTRERPRVYFVGSLYDSVARVASRDDDRERDAPSGRLGPNAPSADAHTFFEHLYGDHEGFADEARDPRTARCRRVVAFAVTSRSRRRVFQKGNALFAACSLAAGALVDRADAVKLTYASCGLWALATVATAYTSSFAGVAACRALQGVAMAATAPAGYALLGRAFPPDKLATASSRYAAAVSAGGALAAVSTRLDDAIGWRGAFAVAGASSLVVALIAFLLLPSELGPPLTPETKEREEGGFGGVFASKAAVALLAATAVRFAAGFTIGVWAIPCLRATFAGNDVGSGYALVVGVFGFVSALLGGAAADGLAARAPPQRAAAARALVPAAGSLVAAPLWVLALRAPSYGIAIALLAAEFLVAECWIGPTTAPVSYTHLTLPTILLV